MVAHALHIHLTVANTGAAVIAHACIYLDADHIESVEQSVDCSKRAEKTAEGTVTEYTQKHDQDHDHELSGK